MSPAMAVAATTQNVKEDRESETQYQYGVKRLLENGIAKLPKKYILPVDQRPNAMAGEIYPDAAAAAVNLKLPVIDFADLMGSNRPQALKSLAYACENYGFFQLVNHGICNEIISNMVDAGTRFFELPFEEREKYMKTDMSSPVRCGTSFNQTKDGVFCWRDFLKLGCHPLSQVLPLWPSSPIDFRKKAVTYAKETKTLFLILVEAILDSLGLSSTNNNKTTDDYDILKDLEQDGSQLMVVNCYPPCPQPELTLGMPPHSDYGFLTLLLQDDVAGLQIKFRQQWLTVQPIPNSFVINVGDHLEIFSNGRYKSVLHRVLANCRRTRTSVASLHSVPVKTKVAPAPELVTESNPRLYKDTDFATFLEYITSCEPKAKNFLESRKIDTIKI